MRILYVQPAELFGGAERQGVMAMKCLPDEGIEVVPVVGPGKPICQAMDEAGIQDYLYCPQLPSQMHGPGTLFSRIVRNAALFESWRNTSTVVAKAVQSHQVDLIYASRAFGWTVASAVGKQLGVKVVWRAGSRATRPVQHLTLGLAGRFRPPDALVCNCVAVRDSIAPSLGCRSFIVPNGVDLNRFDPGRVKPGLRLSMDLGDRPVIGVSARPAPEKGFELLREVIERVVIKVPNLRVLVAGEYPWRSRYEMDFNASGLGKTVTFLGHVNEMEVFYRSCDLVLLTSLKRSIEGSSSALLEAMAMRRPVVATRVGGIAESVTHTVEGLLADPDDIDVLAHHVTSLLLDKLLQARMGKAGRTRVQSEFSQLVGARKLARVLRQIEVQS